MNSPAQLNPTRVFGFDHIRKYYDSSSKKNVIKIIPGDYYVTDQDEIITTVLGSCISACIRDVKVGIGGMNHFMVPAQCKFSTKEGHDLITRYGTYAMEHLINDIYKFGGTRENIEIKLFGAGSVISANGDIGEKNILFVREFIQTEGYTVTAEDLGGEFPRKVNYCPVSGKARVKKMRSVHKQTIVQQEMQLQRQMEQTESGGEVDLF